MGLNGISRSALRASGIFQILVVVLSVLSEHSGTINSVAITADGRWALTGSWDKTARLLESYKSNRVVPVFFQGIPIAIRSVAVTPDGKWALTGSDDTTARLWEIIPRMSLAKVQEIIGAHEETTRNNAKQGR